MILSSTPSTTRSCSRVEAVGMSVFVLWDMSLCAGLDPVISTGVFLYSSKASQGSFSSRNAFLNRLLVTFTADPAFPFDLWWWGDEVTCLNSHSVVNFLNWWLVNCGTFSEMKMSGILCQLNCSFRNWMMAGEVVSLSSWTSTKSEK